MTMLKKITIRGLRGFGKRKTIFLSIPNGKIGSGLTILVGPNNSGKTTILEALRCYNIEANHIAFSEGKRNAKNDHRVSITYTAQDKTELKLDTIPEGGSQVVITGNIDINNTPFVLPSRRHSEYTTNSNRYYVDRHQYAINQILTSRNRSAQLSQYEQRMFKWQENKVEFDKILHRMIPDAFDWTIEQNEDGAYYIKIIFSDKSISHTREGMGDGYWSIFTIADALYDSKENSIIAIDEPELSLHPSLQKRTLALLEEYSKDRQIIITTHSAHFISIPAIVNGATLIRTFKDAKGDIQIGRIDNKDRGFMKSMLKNLNNPHILGLEAKELFFIEDNVVITEGQEDVVIIPNLCEEIGVDLKASLFGWGAGGAGNISKILRLLKNLKYEKVTAIFDGDKRTEYEECRALFPRYNVIILPKDDIRDKPAVSAKRSKEGIADKDGKIKRENEGSFKQIIEFINSYHSA